MCAQFSKRNFGCIKEFTFRKSVMVMVMMMIKLVMIMVVMMVIMTRDKYKEDLL